MRYLNKHSDHDLGQYDPTAIPAKITPFDAPQSSWFPRMIYVTFFLGKHSWYLPLQRMSMKSFVYPNIKIVPVAMLWHLRFQLITWFVEKFLHHRAPLPQREVWINTQENPVDTALEQWGSKRRWECCLNPTGQRWNWVLSSRQASRKPDRGSLSVLSELAIISNYNL